MKVHRHNVNIGSPATVQRTVRVPLENVTDELWMDLRRYAYKCATYGNVMLSESYAKAKGLEAKWTTYTDHRDELSAAVRDAVGRECVGIWRRLGRKILRGEQTLARFAVDRALVIRDRGVQLTKDGASFLITVRCGPKHTSDPITLRVWEPALKRDAYLAGTLVTIESGGYRLSKATLQFERPGRKVYARLAYEKPVATCPPSEVEAVFSWDGDLSYIVTCNGRALHVTDKVHRIISMKLHFAGIRYRLSRSLGKARRWHDYRRALLKAGTFNHWSEGPLHELSRYVIDWCVAQGAGSLRWTVDGDGDFPWAKLREQCTYKGAEHGIVVTSQTLVVVEQGKSLRSVEDKTKKKRVKKRAVAEEVQGAKGVGECEVGAHR